MLSFALHSPDVGIFIHSMPTGKRIAFSTERRGSVLAPCTAHDHMPFQWPIEMVFEKCGRQMSGFAQCKADLTRVRKAWESLGWTFHPATIQ